MDFSSFLDFHLTWCIWLQAGYGLGKLFEKKSVQDLYARILVAIPSAESISGRIQKLQPQMIELLKG
ncbi:hypothetical protein SAY86_007347 [Trapa natans]|uniref:Uncharacterized protein n=1 Tax=Trapa natans TaxID=22666 RepID=A0AAN7R222_TRANT|nr:hypothetical protein SAY86_007347 [Trapa natans]